MKEFTEQEWKEVCEHMDSITSIKECAEYLKEIRSIYGLPLNEMAKDQRSFIAICCGQALNIHYTVANIICLSDTICQDARLHWQHELIEFASKIIDANIEKGVKRTAIAFDNIIDSYMDIYKITHYSYNDTYIYEKAMKAEIKKAQKPTATPAQKIEAKQIEQRIIPNLEKFVKPNQERVSKLFDGFIEACKKEDIDIFEEAVDEFINNSPDVQI